MATTFHLYLRTDKKKKNGKCPIYLRITSDRQHKYISTGLSIHEKYWNDRSEIIRATHSNHKALNDILNNKIEEAEVVYSDLHSGGNVSPSEIKKKIVHKENSDFFTFADEYLKELKKANQYYSRRASNTAFNKLEEFQGERRLPFRLITPEFIEQFISFLKVKHDNSPATIRKNLQPVRRVVKKGIRNGLIEKDPMHVVELPKNKNGHTKTKLLIEQINAMEQLKFKPGSWLWNTRNAFLFSFYSGGIRFGDLCCLTWESVKNDRLIYKMGKNEKPFSTQLNESQKNILNRYTGTGNEYIFPFLNNSKKYADQTELRKAINSKNVLANKNLRKISKKLNAAIDKKKIKAPKIEQRISFHVSRHSFAQYAVEAGLSVYELMQTLRHSKVETTQQYLKGLDEELADQAMKKIGF